MVPYINSCYLTLTSAFVYIVILNLQIISVSANNFVRSIPINCDKFDETNSEFNKRFINFLEKWRLPGASVTIMQNNKTILSCGYGWANIEEVKPIQPNSIFRIASVSKIITAIAILQLIEQNKLNYNDKAFLILSDLKPLNNKKINSDIYNVSILNLLQMSSGWASDRPEDYDPMFGPWSNIMLSQLNYQIPPTCDMAARMMMSEPFQFKPGTQFSYSNFNYCLLGLIINKLSKQIGPDGYESFINKNLLFPLKIYNTKLGSTQYNNQFLNEVKYYFTIESDTYTDIDRILDGLPYGQTDILKKNYAAGGWTSSSSDLAILLQTLHHNKILNPQTKNVMFNKPAFINDNSNYPTIGWDRVNITNEQYDLIKTGTFTGTKAFVLQKSNGASYVFLFNKKPIKGEEFNKELKEIINLIQINNAL